MDSAAATHLVRNLVTEVVHRESCVNQGTSTGKWHWAVGTTLADVSQATRDYPHLHVCRTCLPGVCACPKCTGT